MTSCKSKLCCFKNIFCDLLQAKSNGKKWHNSVFQLSGQSVSWTTNIGSFWFVGSGDTQIWDAKLVSSVIRSPVWNIWPGMTVSQCMTFVGLYGIHLHVDVAALCVPLEYTLESPANTAKAATTFFSPRTGAVRSMSAREAGDFLFCPSFYRVLCYYYSDDQPSKVESSFPMWAFWVEARPFTWGPKCLSWC